MYGTDEISGKDAGSGLTCGEEIREELEEDSHTP